MQFFHHVSHQTATAQQTTNFFIQLELNGVARIGSNPIELLRRNIPGYTLVNTTAPARVLTASSTPACCTPTSLTSGKPSAANNSTNAKLSKPKIAECCSVER